MASGHVNRAKRSNTWAHRPMLQTRRKLLPTRSRPHMGEDRKSSVDVQNEVFDLELTKLESHSLSAIKGNGRMFV